jgi:hypothetical protein
VNAAGHLQARTRVVNRHAAFSRLLVTTFHFWSKIEVMAGSPKKKTAKKATKKAAKGDKPKRPLSGYMKFVKGKWHIHLAVWRRSFFQSGISPFEAERSRTVHLNIYCEPTESAHAFERIPIAKYVWAHLLVGLVLLGPCICVVCESLGQDFCKR